MERNDIKIESREKRFERLSLGGDIPVMSMSPTEHTLEKEIYKAFKKCDNREGGISAILNQLSLGFPFNPKFDYPVESMVKALVFKRLKGIKSQSELVRYLREHDEDSLNLGFFKDVENKPHVPNQRTFSHFLNHIAGEETKKIIDFIVKTISDTSEKFEIGLDIERKKQITKPVTETNIQYRKEEKLGELRRKAKRLVYPKIPIKIRHNAKHTKSQVLDVLVRSAVENLCTHGGAASLKQDREDSPESHVVLYHLKKNDAESVKLVFAKITDEILKLVKSYFKKRKFDISIDYTFVHYYGDKNHPQIVRSEEDHGTTKYFRYISLDIVEKNFRFTLCTLPVFTFSKEVALVKELLDCAKSKIAIGTLYADRGFGNSNMFNLLDQMGINYVIPVSEDSGIRKILQTVPIPFVIKSYKRGNAVIPNLVFVNGKKGLMKIATNTVIRRHDIDLLDSLPRMYGKRWGIETAFRIKKRDGLARTTSNNYALRLFYFLFSVMLYNLWVLIKLMIFMEIEGAERFLKMVVRFKFFLKAFVIQDIT